jgi:hypothetical protein
LDEAGVAGKFGVSPESIPDYLSLAGDAADIALLDDVDELRCQGPKPGFGALGARLDAAAIANPRQFSIGGSTAPSPGASLADPSCFGRTVSGTMSYQEPIPCSFDAANMQRSVELRHYSA